MWDWMRWAFRLLGQKKPQEIWAGVTEASLVAQLKPRHLGTKAASRYWRTPELGLESASKALDDSLDQIWRGHLMDTKDELLDTFRGPQGINLGDPVEALDGIVADFLIAANGHFDISSDDLGRAQNALEDTEQQILDFKAAYRDYDGTINLGDPKAADWLITGPMMVSLIGIEAALNSGFLAPGDPNGTAGAILKAVAISGFNIGLSFVGGFRYLKNLRSLDRRVRRNARIILSLIVVGLVVYNFAVGHFREAAANAHIANVIDYVVSAIIHFRLPSTPDSVYLILLGVAFAAASGVKGLFTGSPFPDFTKLGDKERKDVAKRDKALREALAGLKTILSKFEAALMAKVKTYEDQHEQLVDAIDESQRLVATLIDEATSFDQTAHSIRRAYVAAARTYLDDARLPYPVGLADGVDRKIANNVLDVLPEESKRIADLTTRRDQSAASVKAAQRHRIACENKIRARERDLANKLIAVVGDDNRNPASGSTADSTGASATGDKA